MEIHEITGFLCLSGPNKGFSNFPRSLTFARN